jgi:hypothetical protein
VVDIRPAYMDSAQMIIQSWEWAAADAEEGTIRASRSIKMIDQIQRSEWIEDHPQ